MFGELWGIHNTGQAIKGVAGVADVDIDGPEAWDNELGSPEIVVGIIDTGLDISHPDLADNIWTNPGEIAGGRHRQRRQRLHRRRARLGFL